MKLFKLKKKAESREISVSCKNLFLNQCKINMFKLIKLLTENAFNLYKTRYLLSWKEFIQDLILYVCQSEILNPY